MSSVQSLREHLVGELSDLLNAEEQMIEALPEMAKRASGAQLRTAFRSHLAQTRTHQRRAAAALKALGESASGKTCKAMKGLLAEGEELMSNGEPGALLDAMLITAAQKVEHYEIATYGTVRTYAQVLGEPEVARILDQTLKEEKAADRKLTMIAEGGVNKRAAKEWHEQQTAAGMLRKGAEWIGATVGGAVSRAMPRSQAADRRSARSRSGSKGRTRRAARGRRARS
jgi:ferritin-like metal-binding protein YciE